MSRRITLPLSSLSLISQTAAMAPHAPGLESTIELPVTGKPAL